MITDERVLDILSSFHYLNPHVDHTRKRECGQLMENWAPSFCT